MKELELGLQGHPSPRGAGVPDGMEQGVPRVGVVQAQRPSGVIRSFAEGALKSICK